MKLYYSLLLFEDYGTIFAWDDCPVPSGVDKSRSRQHRKASTFTSTHHPRRLTLEDAHVITTYQIIHVYMK